ncbi:MAG: DUF3299 domain-containing protein [Corallincola sp.]|nr:DUF3299 domain-containing protein [Corallincola sp.]
MKLLLPLLLTTSLLLACSPADESGSTADDAKPLASDNLAEALELDWESLVPPGFEEAIIATEQELASLEDEDPRAEALMAKLRDEWAKAPVVEALDNSLVKLPGFVVPLEGDGQQVRQFLLVPYYGACIHEPPPPANQTVLVDAPNDTRIRSAFETVWIYGRLRVERADTEMATAGYRIQAQKIEPYVNPMLEGLVEPDGSIVEDAPTP